MKTDATVYCIELNQVEFRKGKFLISEEGLKNLVLDYLEIEYDQHHRKNEDEGYFFKGKQLYRSEIVDGSVRNKKVEMLDKDRLLVEATRLFK